MKREGVADLHHAQLQRRIADAFDQTGKHRCGLDQIAVPAFLGEQIGRRAGDDQFADEVDQLIELVGMNAHQLRFAGFLFDNLGLPGDRGLDDLGVHHLVADEDFAERGRGFFPGIRRRLFLVEQTLIDLRLGQRAAPDEHLAETERVFRQFLDQPNVVVDLALRREDAQIAVVAHKIEGAFDVVLARLGLQADFKPEVTGFGVHVFGGRNGVGNCLHPDDFAETA